MNVSPSQTEEDGDAEDADGTPQQEGEGLVLEEQDQDRSKGHHQTGDVHESSELDALTKYCAYADESSLYEWIRI